MRRLTFWSILVMGLVLTGWSAQDARVLPKDRLPEVLLPEVMPLGLPESIPVPEDNQFTPQRVALGRKLFFDPILSADRTISCASCHPPTAGFASPEAFPPGVGDGRCGRNAPTLLNRAFGKAQMWDGRAASLEEQVLMPMVNPVEMALPVEVAIARLKADEAYVREFAAAYGTVDADNLARALATFIRQLVAGDSPVDRFRSGLEREALSVQERAGLWLYESKGGCWRCHSGVNFSDESFHNTGVGENEGRPEDGRFTVTELDEDRGKFKTPTLRGLVYTAPYMHDGSLETLEEVVEFYRDGARKNSHLDSDIGAIELNDEEASNLVAFLKALSRGSLDRLVKQWH